MKCLKVVIMLMLGAMCVSCASTVDSNGNGPTEPAKPVDTPVAVKASINGMSPLSGTPGTVLTIDGSGLSGVTYVCFNQTCVKPTAVNDSSVTVVVPSGQGRVYVSVTKDGRSLGADKFTYLSEAVNPLDVDWCQLSWVKPIVRTGEHLVVNAQVYEKDITGANGTHQGIFAQVGYADIEESELEAFKWYNASRNATFAGEASKYNDEYVTDKIVLEEGRYRVAYRFSLDGYSWLYCDNGGSADGFSMEDAGVVTVSSKPEEIRTIEWCRIVNDTTTITSKPNQNTEMIYAQAYVPGCTGNGGHCESLHAQIGYGMLFYSDERGVATNYIWENVGLNAAYKGTGEEGKYDEFMGAVKYSQVGSYAIVYRMTLNDGESWTYCDTLNDMRFNAQDGIRWKVSEETEQNPVDTPTETKKSISWCRIQHPESIAVEPGKSTEEIYGRVHVDGCTGKESDKSKCPEIKAQVGYGAESADVSGYHYEPASLNTGFSDAGSGVNDEYLATLKPLESGDYRVVYRFSLDNGATWEYCDFDNDIGFKKENTVPMHVAEKPALAADWCRMFPFEPVTMSPGGMADYYGQVHVLGCTEGEGKCPVLKTWFGYGSPKDDLSSFEFIEAGYNKEIGDNDEFMTTIKVPDQIGDYEVVFAFSLNDGPKQYCDTSEKEKYEFSRNDAGKLNVRYTYSWGDGENQYKCGITEGSDSYSESAGSEHVLYGQIYINGCTTSNACCEHVIGGGIVYIEDDEPVETDLVEVEGKLNSEFEKGNTEANINNDEYMTTLKLENAGTYRYKYYFILKDSQNVTQKVYCVNNWKSPEESSISDMGVAVIQ